MLLDFSNKCALVTGASAGIGREFARLLAPEVGTLVLVARRRERLDQLATELSAGNSVRIVVRAVDLCDRPAVGAMLDALTAEGIHIDVLINNAGFGDHGLFETADWPKLEAMLELNVRASTYLLHRVIPGMKARGFGAILNVGSIAGMFASPGLAVYSATKAYFNMLSEALHAELSGTGVSVTALCPGPVPTEFQEVAGTTGRNPLPERLVIDAPTCAREGLLALRRQRPRWIPGTAMRATMLSVEALPKVLVRPASRKMASRLRGTR